MKLSAGKFLSKPYWSNQHGAYITLATAWLVAFIAGRNFSLLHIVILVLLLAGLNFSELIAEKFKRKTPLPEAKKFWLSIYFTITLLTGSIILLKHPYMKYFLPLVSAGLLMFVFLSYKRMQKSVISELIIFALFTLGGLLAYLPEHEIDIYIIGKLFISMFLYFGTSIFTVKSRLNKISFYAPLIYFACSTAILYIFINGTALFYVLSVLILIKSIPASLFHKQYEKLPLKTIGISEAVSHLIFVIVNYYFFN